MSENNEKASKKEQPYKVNLRGVTAKIPGWVKVMALSGGKYNDKAWLRSMIAAYHEQESKARYDKRASNRDMEGND